MTQLQAQVVINEEITIKGNTIMVITDSDVEINADVKGDGQLIVRENQKEVKVVYKGKEIENGDTEKIAIIDERKTLQQNQEIHLAQPSKTVEEPKIVAFPELNIEIEKSGTIILTRIYKTLEESFPISSVTLPSGYLLPFEQPDNYFILNDNYIIITKEQIMSSQNLHDTLFVKDFLDPPKA